MGVAEAEAPEGLTAAEVEEGLLEVAGVLIDREAAEV